MMPRHSKSMSGDKIEEILRNTLPLLCSNAVPYGCQISIDALIGITIDSSEVILVNIHEQLGKPDSQLSNDNLADGYGGQYLVKTELSDDAGSTSFHLQQKSITAAVANSSEYTGSMAGTSGFGNIHMPSADVIDVTNYSDGDDGLGYNENCDLEEDQYMDSFQGSHTGEFGDEYFNAGMTYGGNDDYTGGDLYSGDVKPFSMPTSQVGGYSQQVHKSVTIPSPRGQKRRGAAQTPVSRQSHSTSGTPHRRQPKAAVKKEFADFDETGGPSSNAPHSRGILANEKSTIYTCSVCGKMFRHAGTLQRHKQQHEGVVFRCDLCGAVLSRRDVLIAHRRKCEEKITQQSSSEPFDTM